MIDSRGTGDSNDAPAGPSRPRIGRRRRRLRRTIGILVAVAMLGILVGAVYYWGMRPRLYRPGEDLPEISRNLARHVPDDAPDVRLVDVTAAAGLQPFASFTGARSSQLPEDMGAGAAWGDFDNDGDDDLFLVAAGGSLAAPPDDLAPCMLLENQGDGHFLPVADFPDLRIIGMAAAWGDCNGDGWLDLVITGFNHLLLFRNEAGTLVRDEAFPEPEGFWAGASWGDFDNDRSLDLYVCGYVRYAPDDGERAASSRQYGRVIPYTLNPSSYEPERNLLFRNNGDGTFEEVAEALGVANPEGRSLGAAWYDFNQDGRLDLYVANDISDNVLYVNLDEGFVDASHAAWVADYRGAMGLAVGDYNRDGDDDIFVTHWIAQENALYDSLLVDLAGQQIPENETPPAPPPGLEALGASFRYVDVASLNGLGQSALQMIGWGTEFADFDADGWLDLVVANGSTFETDDEPKRLKPQVPFLFWNRQGRFFHDVAFRSEALSRPCVGRGLAVSDYDQDGDLDVVIVRHGESPLLLRNEMQIGNWVQVRLRSRDRDGNLTGFGDGATIIATVGDATLRRAVLSTSYLSQSSRTIHLGLGEADRIDRLEVRWLGGGTDTFSDLRANTCWEMREGEPEPRRISMRGTEDADEVVAGRPTVESMSEADRIRQFWSFQRAGVHALKVDNDLPAAIDAFRSALALDPDHEEARYYLGNCLAATGDVDGSMQAFERLLELNPRSHRGLKRLGILRASLARSPEQLASAMALLERAWAINPEETGVPLTMGEIAIMQGEHADAEQKLEWVCQTNPRAVGALFLRGYIAWERGEDVRSGEFLQRARDARGEEWKPEGMTAEGDVGRQMHTELTPLTSFWQSWNGSLELAAAYAPLHEFLASRLEGRVDP
ncbi:MAG: FG-GAP-like repeat-containing protein [Planctomycetota bacterium]|jgi:Flp pilus assembly protein TadD